MDIKTEFQNERPQKELEENQDVKEFERKQKGRPSVFIGSSRESLPIAEFVKSQFDEDLFNVDIWDEGIFGKSHSNIHSLKNFTDIYDFAIFLFVPDDEIVSQTREEKNSALKAAGTRHNVVFEFGLFLGHIGSKKTYILFDNDVKDFVDKFFTDLEENPLDTRNTYISLYSYKGKYKEWIRTKGENLQYEEESLKEQVELIKKSILKNFEDIDIGFLPSTTLAFGYFNNFITIVVRFINQVKKAEMPDDLKKLCEENPEIKRTAMAIRDKKNVLIKVIIPDALTGARHAEFKKDYDQARFINISVPGISRPMTTCCQPNSFTDTEDNFVICDVPSTLNSSIPAIDMLNPHKQIRELLSGKEIRNFPKALKYLIETNKNEEIKNIKDIVSIVTWEEYKDDPYK